MLYDVFSLGKGPWDPSHRFETSWLLHPWVLFAIRLLFALYVLATRLAIIGFECSLSGCATAGNDFSYFTVLSHWAMGVYFLIAAIYTASYAATGRPLLDRLPRALQAVYSLYYTTIITFPFLVTVVYWAIIYQPPFPTDTFDAWKQISQHALNSVFALFEVLVPRTDAPPLIHALWLIIILALYLGLAYVTLATKGFYVYNFLSPSYEGSRGKVAAYVIAVLVAALIAFAIVKAVIWLRLWLTERLFGMGAKNSAEDCGTASTDPEMRAV